MKKAFIFALFFNCTAVKAQIKSEIQKLIEEEFESFTHNYRDSHMGYEKIKYEVKFEDCKIILKARTDFTDAKFYFYETYEIPMTDSFNLYTTILSQENTEATLTIKTSKKIILKTVEKNNLGIYEKKTELTDNIYLLIPRIPLRNHINKGLNEALDDLTFFCKEELTCK